MKIAILDDYQDVVRDLACFSLLSEHNTTVLSQTYTEQALIAQLKDVEALVLIRERTTISESMLAALPRLKLISQTGKISQHIDPKLCQKYGVDVAEGIGSPVAPAELCWALIMAASRNLVSYASKLQSGLWQQTHDLGLGRSLNGLTMGIWGYGKIGQRIANYAKAFGMQVMVWGSERSRQQAVTDGFKAAQSKTEFFCQSDVLSMHLRLNEVTEFCVQRTDLAMMKADALFVNTSRAELVEPGALFEVLSDSPSKRAALDVYQNEPAMLSNEPLLGLPNVLALPHLGYVETNSYELYFKKAFENVLAYAQGKPQNLIESL
ncbi:D-2-hydroxyacid dehydrogenase family protein [Alginatibacterium sediminis]|uniref:D-2-hydroxyacid dehydrogenase family protein n=1 Tax=Alginatibacterium sediminis TaxID=2164068 RepID=A0A420EI67_9ALTE|nr:D-2-hydroxyacid dehydrogenase family protein [Alginatibacterium sediminis]RKF20388.1 D-2-hydroxyacid dehydrogenase family protein [Alginatibacterium sediminis]